ncbi:hypothetical protein FF38_04210 [Lucilia cuprina]|uniref:Secreted protein n=1 Tax=Lucilia cuprina TaxID=7375 RepID=A0A0L0BLF6_LUCCU|nr:hypothetical protein FF38_04210 [Lucilia cuprina]
MALVLIQMLTCSAVIFMDAVGIKTWFQLKNGVFRSILLGSTRRDGCGSACLDGCGLARLDGCGSDFRVLCPVMAVSTDMASVLTFARLSCV